MHSGIHSRMPLCSYCRSVSNISHPVRVKYMVVDACAEEEVSLLARLAGRLTMNSGGAAGPAAVARPGRVAAAAAAKKTTQVVALDDR